MTHACIQKVSGLKGPLCVPVMHAYCAHTVRVSQSCIDIHICCGAQSGPHTHRSSELRARTRTEALNCAHTHTHRRSLLHAHSKVRYYTHTHTLKMCRACTRVLSAHTHTQALYSRTARKHCISLTHTHKLCTGHTRKDYPHTQALHCTQTQAAH